MLKFYLKLNGTPYHISFYKKRLACIAYQPYYNLAPPGITNLFTKHVTKYNVRDNLTFDLTHSYWIGLNDSFTHRASIIWNALPVKIKSSPFLASFKVNIAKHSKSIDGIYLLGPVPLLHTRILMTLFTFRLPFYKLCYLFIYACRTLLYPCS